MASTLGTLGVPIGIGTLQWGDSWLDEKMVRGGRLDEDAVREIVGELLRAGVTFFDSAEGYGGGSSERRLGALTAEALREGEGEGARPNADSAAPAVARRPAGLCLATKFLPTFWRFSRASLLRAARASRERLGLAEDEPIPLYFIHTPVHYRSVEFWVDACCDAADAGIIDEIGLSNFNADQVERAARAAAARGRSIAANQIMFSLLDYSSPRLQATVDTCRKHGITVVAYSPIGQGLLTDGLTPEKLSTIRAARMTRVKFDDLTPIRTALAEIAAAHGKTMAQVCLQWVIAHGAVPLVGCRSVQQARDSLGGASGWSLATSDVARLDGLALARSTLEGSRFKRGFFATLFGFVILVYRVIEVFAGGRGGTAAAPKRD
jgi:aryl-alcohol dehydrogenase-like predicted oxidoreductase